jgi:hypothetical protein
MLKAVGMFMLLLTSMWKLNVLRAKTNTTLRNMACRSVTVCSLMGTNCVANPNLNMSRCGLPHLETFSGGFY